MKTLITILLLASCFSSIIAQKITSPGKVIIGGNEIDGFLTIAASEKTPQQFSFSETRDGISRDITNEASRIILKSGEWYEPFFVRIDQIGKPYFSRQKSDYTGNSFSGKRWLQNVIAGSVSLYFMYDDTRFPHFFYRDSSEKEVTKLVYMPYLAETALFVDEDEYKIQLMQLFQAKNCAGGEKETKTLSYELDGLKRIFKKLNECSGELAVDHFSKPNKPVFTLGPVTGLYLMQIRGLTAAVVPFAGAHIYCEPASGKKDSDLVLTFFITFLQLM